MASRLRRTELEQAGGGAVETLQRSVPVEHQQRVVDTVLDALQFGVEFLRLGGLDLQLFVDRCQFLVRRLKLLVRRFEFFIRRLHFLVRGLNLLIQCLHFLVRRLQFLDQRLQMLARRGKFVLEFLLVDATAVLDRRLAGRWQKPLDTEHEQSLVAGVRDRVNREANAARRVERLDMPGTAADDGLFDLRLAHQHLDFGTQLATDQRDQVESRPPWRHVEQPAGVTMDVADLELAVDQDRRRDEMAAGRLEQDRFEALRRNRLARSLMLVEAGCRELYF